MNNNIKCISIAMVAALGCSAETVNAQHVVTSMTLTDFDNDGLKSDFSFNGPPPGNSAASFGAGDELCGYYLCSDIYMDTFIHPDTFTMGFDYLPGGAPLPGGAFRPYVFGTVSATIDPQLATAGDGQALQFSSLDLGAIQNTFIYDLSPNLLHNCTGELAAISSYSCGKYATDQISTYFNAPLGYNVDITSLTGGDYGVVIHYVVAATGNYHPDFPSAANFIGENFYFRLEGVMHTQVPVPAAIWLFGTGLLGLLGVSLRRAR